MLQSSRGINPTGKAAMMRDVPLTTEPSGLTTLLDALETAVPGMTGTAGLRPADWLALERRLKGLQRLLASAARSGRPGHNAGGCTSPATLF